MITRSVNDAERVTLYGNTHPLTQSATDLGSVAEDIRLEHMEFQLKRSAAGQEELDRYIEELHDPQ
ncbi:MAG: hypothetical protein M3Y24_13460, partial [Acidobacteriota bacterium]|nr:hypothetical protein [Acidobacteriota bacterium]